MAASVVTLTVHPSFVMPAKAGIQGECSAWNHWIPALRFAPARMTMRENESHVRSTTLGGGGPAAGARPGS